MIEEKNNVYTIKYDNTEYKVSIYGGKGISLKIDDKEFFSGKDVNNLLFGNSFWPSPQSIWNWPPPQTLDYEKYTSEIINEKLILTSQKDKKLGFQFVKEFEYDESSKSFINTYFIKNISFENKKVAPWEVSRVVKGGIAFFPKGKNNTWGQNIHLMDFTESNNIVWYESKAKVYDDHTKLFNNGSEGWLTFVQDGYIFIKKFEVIPSNAVAPGEDQIEIYANPIDNYIEVEAQGAYQELKPAESLKWEVQWFVRKLENIKENVGNNELVEFVREILK